MHESRPSEQASPLRLTVLGTRGSMAVSGTAFAEFGGSTSCYLVEAGGESIILDAGTGLMHAPTTFSRTPHILLSHLHLDHLIGLGMYGRLSMTGATTRLYLPAESAEKAKRLLDSLYAPPLWPLGLGDYPGDLVVEALPETLAIGSVRVSSIEGCHPGGCRVLRLDCQGKSIVYATDYECEPVALARLTEFARGTDLLLFDGQYRRDELAAHRGFGHSTAEQGLELMGRCGAKRLLLIHHDPHATDEDLRERERALGTPAARYAREGETVEL